MTTARVTTEEGVANLALSGLREPEIALMTDDSTAARAARKWFVTVRRAVLRKNNWNFSTMWAQPAQDPVAGIGFLKKRYPLPADCCRVRFVTGLDKDEWAVEGAVVTVGGVQVEANVLVCNVDGALICYSRDVTNIALWDDEAIEAFASALAARMAGEFGKTAADVIGLRQVAGDDIDEAATRDAQERARTEISRDTTWTRARRRFPQSGRWCR